MVDGESGENAGAKTSNLTSKMSTPFPADPLLLPSALIRRAYTQEVKIVFSSIDSSPPHGLRADIRY
jgi:hypothetical protein